ncbi:MAG TPA: hypothetical protein VJZ00_19460 [Thermoanaerobaculia bacterium]|nr:hypothetical protein [Thermoanaerobaculia bacterium]
MLLSLALSVPIAPLPNLPGPVAFADLPARSATNGETTLAVWTNRASSVHHNDDRVFVRFLGDGNAFALGAGTAGGVATNGRDYLVTYSTPQAVIAQLGRANGEVGAPVIVERAANASTGAVAWNGARWLTGFTIANESHVAILDESLNVESTIDLGAGALFDIVNIAGTRWGFTTRDGIVHATSLDARAAHFATSEESFSAPRVVAVRGGALLFTQRQEAIELTTFKPLQGFSAMRLILPGQWVLDAREWQSRALLLHSDPASDFAVRASLLDLDGTIDETTTLFEHEASNLALGDSKDGLVLFQAANLDLFAYPLDALAPLDRASRELVSLENVAVQRAPLLASNGTNEVAFWSQTIDASRKQATFTRVLPFGEPEQLPFSLDFTYSRDAVFNGRNFIVGRSNFVDIQAVAVSADGKTAGALMTLGNGRELDLVPNFAVWLGSDGNVRGTPLRDDASPEVPGGIVLEPAPFGPQSAPAIATTNDGYVVYWSELHGVKRVELTPAGTIRSSRFVDTEEVTTIVANGEVAAWKHTLFAFGTALHPEWGEWTPIDIVSLDEHRARVFVSIEGTVFTSIVTRDGVGPLQPLGRIALARGGATASHVLYEENARVYVAPVAAPARRRAVR